MFSKHRKLLLTVLCLLSGLLLALGCTVFSWQWNEDPAFATTIPHETSLKVTTPTLDPESSTRSTDPTQITYKGYTEAGNGSQRKQSERSLRPYLQAGSLFFGIVLGALFLLNVQVHPVLGPEVDLTAVISILYGGMGVLTVNDPQNGVMAWAMMSLGLFCLRELISWIRCGCKADWCVAHRMGTYFSRNGKKRYYLLCCLLAVVLSFCGVTYVIAQKNHFRSWWWIVAWSSGPALMCLLAWISLMRFGKAVDGLSDRIQRFYEGVPITVDEGVFGQEQARLAAMGERMEEAVRKAVTGERFKVDLIANVSHDLRTPLTSILGYAELLEGEVLSDTGREQLMLLNRKAGYMRDLVESLFELTKVSSGVLEAKRDQIDLIRLLEQTIGLFDDRLTSASLQIRRHYCAEHIPVVTDGARMHQVFANLFGNAIKYALPGTRIHLEVKEDDLITVRVTNIASYEMDFGEEEILQRFARGDKARSTSGSGIGLAIAQTYTASVGGHFRVVIDGDQFSAIVELPKN